MAHSVARRRRTYAAALPECVRPQLTQLVDAAPEGDQWLHEIKYDGYRMHARLDSGAVKLLTRTGLDWAHKYPSIAKAVAALDARQAYLDGEFCGVVPTPSRHSASCSLPPTAGTPPLSSSSCLIFSTSTAKISASGR